jgi:hypothetical protein
MKFELIRRTINRVRYMKTRIPYERVLSAISQRNDAWVVSQGEFIRWWHQRASSNLQINISNGTGHVSTDLSNAVIEVFPNEFHPSSSLEFACPNSTLNGPVLMIIDPKLKNKEIFEEVLRREGILNYAEGTTGKFFFSEEVSPILDEIALMLKEDDLRLFEQSVIRVRKLIIDRLAEAGSPLIRIGYHPYINNRIIKVVVSPRHDVEREMSNMPDILDLEDRYHARSTLHLRSHSPFYGHAEIRDIMRHPACSEVALHGEFIGQASRFGGVLEATVSEKRRLEEITGYQVLGVSLHGGELLNNNTLEAKQAISKVGFLYNTSNGPTPYYFPYRLLIKDGSFDETYQLNTNFGDIRIPYSKRYADDFFNEAMHQVEKASERGGILVMMLHPLFFDLFNYLIRPVNLIRLFRFLPTYLNRLLRS